MRFFITGYHCANSFGEKMDLFTLLLIAVGLAMDCFAVTAARSMAVKRFRVKEALLMASFFAAFQVTMPLLGYLAGNGLKAFIGGFDHWVAFVLLCGVGGKMIWESLYGGDEEITGTLQLRELLLLSLATSIDAFAIGITLSLIRTPLIFAIAAIGIVTFIFTIAASWLGIRFGHLVNNRAGLLGGVILIGIGVRILIEHLGSGI